MTERHPSQTDVQELSALLRGWLAHRVSDDARAWIDQQVGAIAGGERPLALGVAIGLAPRKVGKADLDLTPAEQAAGRALRPGLDPTGWSVDQAARILLVLASFRGDDVAFASGIERFFATAEIGEQIALLRGLPMFPAPERLLPYAAEGIRSAMQPVFEAVAHRNPYPRECFSEAQWNQMVVKTLFIGSRLAPIQGLDARRNADLARMLLDYAAERRAAGRSISPELWRCVAPFAGDTEVTTLATILRDGTESERRGAALALAECQLASAKVALDTAPDLASAARDGRLTWDSVA
ncbi:EboA domain-containing protein [Hyphomicrobium sp.]|uniref:EboA domain-containing protein n=1 Tax=Hyphomicrobium sp. TaxID=82 RepID=UPI0025C2E4F2|nr:EboA domain-containing protein [Hyphomicrobium sp.]